MSEACAHCGGDTRLCTTLCCQGECGEEDCRYVWAAYGWRAKHGLLSVVPNEACDALAVMLREADERNGGNAPQLKRSLETLTAAVTAMAIKYDAQWVEEVCRRLDALRDAAERALGIEHRREKIT